MNKNKYSIFLIVLLFFVCSNSNLSAHKQDINFTTFYNKEELINKTINCLFIDSYGFLWLGTEQGLFSFDGYKFSYFEIEQFNQNPNKSYWVNAIVGDSDNNLWVGTSKGLYRIHLKTKKVSEYLYESGKSNSISSNNIEAIYLDKRKHLWFASEKGLCLYNKSTDDFKQYLNHVPKNTVVGKEIISIEEDYSGNLWLGTWSAGLIKFNIRDGVYTNFNDSPTNQLVGYQKVIQTIKSIDNNTLLISNNQKGLLRYNTKTNIFDDDFYQQNKNHLKEGTTGCFYLDKKDRLWLTQNDQISLFVKSGNDFIYSPIASPKNQALLFQPYYIYEGKDHDIWILTHFETLVYSHPAANDFSKFVQTLPKDKINEKKYVTSFVFDKDKNLWMATYDKGVYKLDTKTGKYTAYLNDKVRIISNLFFDNNGMIWVSTMTGLFIINPETNKIQPFTLAENVQSLYISVYQDSNDNYWILNEEGVNCYNFKTGFSKKYSAKNLQGLSSFKAASVIEDADNNIWIGTSEGLNRINTKTNEIKHYFNDNKNDKSLPSSYILNQGLYVDDENELWICTISGICKYDKSTDTFRKIGISGAASIITKKDSFLWISNDGNLIKYNILTNKKNIYSKSDGVNINNNGIYDTKTGEMYVGGRYSDFYLINLNEIKENTIKPKVYITGFFLFNKEINVSSDVETTPLKENIITAKEIEVLYNQNTVGFEFTALNYLYPEKNEYAYKLEGVDKEWISADYKKRYVSYGNLTPGTYVFRVKASNNDGVWNETGTSLKLIVLPPWWKTIYAYLVYFSSLLLLILFARRLTLKQAQLKNSFRIEHILREKEAEIHELKTRFFTNISHEFRTPLTLLSGPINKLISMAKDNNWNEDVLNYFNLIQRNVKRLADLTNQLLDLRKLESNNMKLEIYQANVVNVIRNIVGGFNELASKKNISYKFTSSYERVDGWVDADKIEKILINLLSNAFKFTEQNGSISVEVNANSFSTNTSGKYIEILVKDSGVGIPEDKLEVIFNHFYQVDNTTTSKNEGTGIGLALVKELVTLYNGEISAQSTLGEGSTFRVLLPLEKEQFTNFIILSKVDNDKDSSNMIQHEVELVKPHEVVDTDISKKPLILVAEDNSDMRFYLQGILNDQYIIKEFENGLDAYNFAVTDLPDLILSDIMMPEMDGTELAEKIKADERTNHIPIILLTALNSTDNRLKGLITGADDYITKPFNEEILKLKIKNLLHNRNRQKMYLIKQWELSAGKAYSFSPQKVEVEDLDEKFIQKALKFVEENIDNYEFSVEELATELVMHSNTLYRKFNAILNMNPSDFIRDVRMKRAIQLLESKQLNVSEVAFMVGFNEPKYFSKVFKKQFGKSPTEYTKK